MVTGGSVWPLLWVLGEAFAQPMMLPVDPSAPTSNLERLLTEADVIVVGTVERSSVEEPVPGWPITWAEVRVTECLLGEVTSGLIRIGLPGGRTADGGRVVLAGPARLVLGARVIVFGSDVDGASIRLERGPYTLLTEDTTTRAMLTSQLDSLALVGDDFAPGACKADRAGVVPPADCLATAPVTFDAVRARVSGALATPGLATGRTLPGYTRPDPGPPDADR